jgi:MFS family permease
LSISDTLFYLFAYRELGLTSAFVGVAVAMRGAGALAGALLAVALERRLGIARTLVAGVALYGAGSTVAPAAAAGLAAPVLMVSRFLLSSDVRSASDGDRTGV